MINEAAAAGSMNKKTAVAIRITMKAAAANSVNKKTAGASRITKETAAASYLMYRENSSAGCLAKGTPAAFVRGRSQLQLPPIV
jgi:hypothetical protein